MMLYKEYDGVLYRADDSVYAETPMTQRLVNGQWKPCGIDGLDARLYGDDVSEEEVKAGEYEGGSAQG